VCTLIYREGLVCVEVCRRSLLGLRGIHAMGSRQSCRICVWVNEWTRMGVVVWLERVSECRNVGSGDLFEWWLMLLVVVADE